MVGLESKQQTCQTHYTRVPLFWVTCGSLPFLYEWLDRQRRSFLHSFSFVFLWGCLDNNCESCGRNNKRPIFGMGRYSGIPWTRDGTASAQLPLFDWKVYSRPETERKESSKDIAFVDLQPFVVSRPYVYLLFQP